MSSALPGFLDGGGEMGMLMRGLDWSATPLGNPSTWSQSLRTVVRLALSSRHPMFIWWGPQLVQLYNDAYRQMMGPEKHPAALAGSGYDWWPEAWPIIGPQIESVMSGGPATWHENQMVPIHRHGSDEAVYWTYGFSPIDDELAPHGIGGVLVVCRDVTEERGLRATLASEREDERRRRRIIESAVDYAIIAMDQEGLVTDWNSGAERILGWSADEMQGVPADRIFTVEDRMQDRPGVEMRGALNTGDAKDERLHVRKDGSEFWASGEMMPMRDENGIHLGFIKILRDMTERKKAEGVLVAFNETLERRIEERTKALRDAEDFTRLALSAVGGVGVWTYDVASDRFFCDASISELYGLDPVRAAAGISRTDFLANVHSDDRKPLRATMGGGLKQSGDLELEYRLVHPDGSVRWVLSRGHTYFDEAGEPVRRTGVGVETTIQRQLEQQLRQSQKMEAVGQLTGGLAHDFNNLLTGITGSLELLQTRIAQGRVGDVGRYIDAAQGATKRAAALTHRLLAFSRRQTLDPKPTDANRLVSGMEELIRRTVGPSIQVEVAAQPDLGAVLVDPNQLENALLNLCINARDAMPTGGRLAIETANRSLDARAAQERDLPPGDYVALSVSDTGTGMTADVIAKAFDPFFTTKPIGQGTGLGLSMIYGFTRQSGGQVRIHSEPGRGTSVSLYLPRHGEVATDEEALPVLADAPRAHEGETVLVVDDEPTVRMLITDVLAELGYIALEAEDGASGLALLRSGRRIDLLVTDVGLPGGINGRQMADASRVVRPDLKVLFITGYAEKAVLSHGHLDPGMHVLTKPFALEALASRIKNLINAG